MHKDACRGIKWEKDFTHLSKNDIISRTMFKRIWFAAGFLSVILEERMVLVLRSARAADRAADEAGVYRKFGGCSSPFRSGTQAFLQNGAVNASDKGKATNE